MSEKKRLLKNTGLIALGNVGAKITSFLLLPLYTSILSTEEYGTYDFIVAISGFLLPIVTLCMHEAMFRFIIEKGNDKKTFSNIVSHAFLTILIGLTILSVGTVIVNYINPFDYCFFFLAYLIANVLYVFAVNLLRGMGEMKSFAIISSGRNILQVILNILAVAVLNLGFKGFIISMFISEMLAVIVTIIKCKLWHYVRFNNISIKTIKEMLIYSLPLVPNAVSAQIIHISDRMIIIATIGTAPNGIYSVSYKFPNIIETVYHYFYSAWSESASRVFEKGKEEATKYYQSLYKTVDNMMFSVILFLTAAMPILFRIFIKGDYVQGFVYVPMLMFAMYFDSLGKFYSGIFTALKKTKAMAWSTVCAAIVNIIINLTLINKIGLYAAAASTLIADIILVVFRRISISKSIELKTDYKRLVIEVIAAALIIFLYSYDNYIKIAISLIIAAAYALIANRNIIKSIITSIKKKIKP